MATPRDTLWERDPHTAEKHALVRHYLDAWWPIILSKFPTATYAEGFAGPGEYKGGEDGSPVLAMRSLLNHSDKDWWSRLARFVFIEERGDRFDNLGHAVDARVGPLPAHFRVTMRQGSCSDQLLPALDAAGAWDQPIFVMLDPFNVNVPYEVVSQIGSNRSSEVLITFMSDWLSRWAKDESQTQGDRLFGDQQWRNVVHQPAEEKRRWLVDLYRERLKEAGFTYRLAFELLDEGGHAFFLVHGTTSDKGLEKMKEAMWRVDPHRGVRFRDPRDTRQLSFDMAGKPDLSALQSMMLDYLQGREEAVTVAELRRWALFDTVFREKDVPDVLRTWRDRYRHDPVIELDPPRGQINRRTSVRLLRRPQLGQTCRTSCQERLRPSRASGGQCGGVCPGHVVPRAAVEFAPACFGSVASPLLEKERDPELETSISSAAGPGRVHRAVVGARFPADDHPVHQIEHWPGTVGLAEGFGDVLEQRLRGHETNSRGGLSQ